MQLFVVFTHDVFSHQSLPPMQARYDVRHQSRQDERHPNTKKIPACYLNLMRIKFRSSSFLRHCPLSQCLRLLPDEECAYSKNETDDGGPAPEVSKAARALGRRRHPRPEWDGEAKSLKPAQNHSAMLGSPLPRVRSLRHPHRTSVGDL